MIWTYSKIIKCNYILEKQKLGVINGQEDRQADQNKQKKIPTQGGHWLQASTE